MWVFGYGSLVWKADFPYKNRLIGYIKGYVRRFWQSSEDHRGVPGRPGRVVTLLPSVDPEAQVWGVAYEIAKENEDFVLQHLDMREKNGYNKVTVTFHPSELEGVNMNSKQSKSFELVIYVGTEDNKWFAGAADIESIAQQIVNSAGRSGTNTEYLYRLASAMRVLAPDIDDDHLFSVESAVRHLECEQTKVTKKERS